MSRAGALATVLAGALTACPTAAAEESEAAPASNEASVLKEDVGDAESFKLYRDTFIYLKNPDREVCLAKGSIAHRLTTNTWRFKAQACAGSTLPDLFNTKDQQLEAGAVAAIRTASTGVRFAWGTLVVPYKFQLSKDRELKGGATIGPYLGARFSWESMGLELTPHIFVGAGSTSVMQNVNGTDREQGLFALSYGAGVNFAIDEKLNAGFAVGFDHVDDSAGYKYNDKPWVSFQIGIDFSE